MSNINSAQQGETYHLNTDQFGALNRVKAQSIRARVSNTGSYFGVKPKKLANNRLLWPAVQVEKHD